MKTQLFAIRAVSAIVPATLVILAVASCSPRQEHFQDLPGLVSAMQAFSRDLTNRGQPLPQSVSLDELVSRGYISSNSVRAFEGMETKVWFTANPAIMNSVLMSARYQDGSVSAALGDGSVQQFSAQSFAEHLKKSGQQATAASPR